MDEICTLRTEDIDESIRLSQFAFQFELTPSEFEEARTEVKPEQIYGCYVDGKLAAKLSLLPLVAYVGGTPYAMGGVAGVATWPEYRRGRRVEKLLHHALETMRHQGQTISMLAPFKFSFYRRYGWEHTIDRKQYTLSREDWPKYPEAKGSVRRSDDIRQLGPVYEAYAANYNGMLQRTSNWWERKAQRWGASIRAIYYSPNGVAEGYVIYQVKQSQLTVHELVYVTEEARRGIWNYLGNHDSMADKLTVVVPANDALPFLLSNPRITQEVIPYFMARIVDVEAFLRSYPFVRPRAEERLNSSDAARLQLHIVDAHAPWNEGTYTVEIPADEAVATTVEHCDTTDDNTISLDIQSLTAIMFGYQRPSVLHQVGRVSGSNDAVSALDRVIPKHIPFLYDFF